MCSHGWKTQEESRNRVPRVRGDRRLQLHDQAQDGRREAEDQQIQPAAAQAYGAYGEEKVRGRAQGEGGRSDSNSFRLPPSTLHLWLDAQALADCELRCG